MEAQLSILEVELEKDLQQRLNEVAARRGLPASELIRVAVKNLLESEGVNGRPLHSIMELHGLGAEIWKDESGNLIDAQEYVNELRGEWDHRP